MSKKFHNRSNEISASEINRFLYCKKQWYLERLYGHQTIKRLHDKALQEGTLTNKPLPMPKRKKTDSSKSHFVRGQQFHKEYLRILQSKRALVSALFLLLILLIILGGFIFFWPLIYENWGELWKGISSRF